MLQANEIIRDGRGAERCHRVVKQAIPKVAGDDTQGYKYIDAYCNSPVILSISEGGKTCPKCEKQPPIGWVNPQVTNSAGIVLTQKELESCGVTEDTSTKPVKVKKEPKKAVEAKVSKTKKDELVITVPLGSLEDNADIAAFLIKKASEALDSLPVTNFAESKRLIKLQEKLEQLVQL